MSGRALVTAPSIHDALGVSGPLGCLNEARFGIFFGAMGTARDSLDTALDYSTTRVQFDKPVAGFQITQTKLADMAVELFKGILLALHRGRLKDAGEVQPEQISIGKLNNVREAISDRPHVSHNPRRIRHHHRVLATSSCHQPRVGADLRTDERSASARPGASPDRYLGVPVNSRNVPVDSDDGPPRSKSVRDRQGP